MFIKHNDTRLSDHDHCTSTRDPKPRTGPRTPNSGPRSVSVASAAECGGFSLACLINHRLTDLTDAVSIERDNFIVSWLGGPALCCTNRLGSAKMFDLHLFTGECVLSPAALSWPDPQSHKGGQPTVFLTYPVRFAPILCCTL